MKIMYLGVDLANNVFALHGVDEFGKPALVRSNVKRDQLCELIANLPPCVIGMEACSGGLAGRGLTEFGPFGPSRSAKADLEPQASAPLGTPVRRLWSHTETDGGETFRPVVAATGSGVVQP